MSAIINKNFGVQSDSIRFGSTYYTVEVKNTNWVELQIIKCNTNEDFIKQIESERLIDSRFSSYKIVKKEVPVKFTDKKKWNLFVTIEKQMNGTRFIMADNYEHAKQIQYAN